MGVEEHANVHKKSSSAKKDEKNLKLHVRPRFGTRKIDSLGLDDIARMHREMRAPGAANRVLALCSKILNLAEKWGLRPEHSNPCRHVTKYPERKIHNSISEIELARLAKALRAAEDGVDPSTAENPHAIAAIRLLMFTGCRREEVLKLQWSEVRLDRHRLELGDSKTGEKHVPLNAASEEILRQQERRRSKNHAYVFPGTRKGKPLVGLPRIWYRVRKEAGLRDEIRIHDFRHAFSEIAAGTNMSLPMIGRLLGHKVAATTMRYLDFADDPQRQATELVAEKLTAAMAAEFTPGSK